MGRQPAARRVAPAPGKAPQLQLVPSCAEASVIAYRQEVLQYVQERDYPGEYYEHPQYGEVLTPEAHDRLLRLFWVFGVTEFDPSASDPETVANTWLALVTDVGRYLRMRATFGEQEYKEHMAMSRLMSPALKAYLEALWAGERAGIEQGARVFGLTGGLPKGAPDPS